MIEVYESLVRTGKMPTLPPAKVGKHMNTVTVWPHTYLESASSGGIKIELEISGTTLEQAVPSSHPSSVEGQLGAGNYSAPLDIISSLFMENKVVVWKASPVNESISTIMKAVFEPVISHPQGPFLAIVTGGIDVGQAILQHPLVDSLTMTGGVKSFMRIVWGQDTPLDGPPLVSKPFRSELGGVHPYIIVPGKWSASQLEAHAQQLVVFRMINGGHVCAAPQVVITSKTWAQREQFLARVQELFSQYPGTRAFYPGLGPVYEKMKSGTPNIQTCDNEKLFEDQFHPLFATGCEDLGCEAVKNEAFCPVMAEVPLETGDVAQFLKEAVVIANEKCFGTLTSTIIVDPKTHATYGDNVEEALAGLKHGAVNLNFPILSLNMAQAVWGGHPGSTIHNPQSGIGYLGNAYGVQGVVKTVMRAPFTFMGQLTVPFDRAAAKKQNIRMANFHTDRSVGNLMMLAGNLVMGI
jgi:acyl-CoA reductase-like NAD-dependent aldehyde dehydrogenase